MCGGKRWVYDTQYLLGTAFVDPKLKEKIVAACDFTASEPSSGCATLVEQMGDQVDHVNLCARGRHAAFRPKL